LGNTNFGPGVGASTTCIAMPELEYGRLRAGALLGTGPIAEGLPITSESIKHNINELVSATLNPSRGISDTVRGASDISGDINFELRGQGGFGQMIKHAMGDGTTGSANYVRVADARGDIGVQADGYTVAQIGGALVTVPVKCDRTIMAEWDALWGVAAGCTYVHVSRNLVTGVLVANPEVCSGFDGGAAVLGNVGEPYYRHFLNHAATPANDIAADVHDNSWIFPYDAADLATAFLHYIELGQDLPIGLNIDVLRDIALFVYTGMHANTFTMNFNSGEIVNGTFGMVGMEEHVGAELTADFENDNLAGNITFGVTDLRIFQFQPLLTNTFLGIGGEGEVYYDGVIGVPVVNMDLDGVHFDVPIPGTIDTVAGATGSVNNGTDIIDNVYPAGVWPAGAAGEWGWFAGTVCWPMTHRANDTANPVDIIALIPDLPPFNYFEARAEMTSGLTNTNAVGAATFLNRGQGLEFVDVMSATFTVDNAIFTDKYELGSRYRKKAPPQQRNVTGTLSIEFDDMRQYYKFFRGRKFALIIRCISDDPDRGLLAGCNLECPYSVCFYMRRCGYTGETPNASSPDMIVSDMPYRSLVYNGVQSAGPTYVDKAFTELAVWMTNLRSAALWT